jgi:hypothetical protein
MIGCQCPGMDEEVEEQQTWRSGNRSDKEKK